MNQATKITKLHYGLIGLLLAVLIGGGVFWLIMDVRAGREWQAVQAAINSVKEKIDYQPADTFGGCVHPDNGAVIVSVNHNSFFGVKDSQVFIPELTRIDIENSQRLGPDLPVAAHDINPYYLYEYCR